MKKIFIKIAACFISLLLVIGSFTDFGSGVKALGNPYGGGWSNCTWSAWQLAYQATGIELPDFGSAGSWARNAAAMGYTVSSVPAANSIIVYSGHVGYVAAVSEDQNSVYIQEGGWMGGYNEGWYPAYTARTWQTLIGYIYLGDVPVSAERTKYTVDELTAGVSASEAKQHSEEAEKAAAVQKTVEEEESRIVRIDDAAGSDESLKADEKEAAEKIRSSDEQSIKTKSLTK